VRGRRGRRQLESLRGEYSKGGIARARMIDIFHPDGRPRREQRLSLVTSIDRGASVTSRRARGARSGRDAGARAGSGSRRGWRRSRGAGGARRGGERGAAARRTPPARCARGGGRPIRKTDWEGALECGRIFPGPSARTVPTNARRVRTRRRSALATARAGARTRVRAFARAARSPPRAPRRPRARRVRAAASIKPKTRFAQRHGSISRGGGIARRRTRGARRP
jgi:hypothetical protein